MAAQNAAADSASGHPTRRTAPNALEYCVVGSGPLVLDLRGQKNGEQDRGGDAGRPSKGPFARAHHLLLSGSHVLAQFPPQYNHCNVHEPYKSVVWHTVRRRGGERDKQVHKTTLAQCAS